MQTWLGENATLREPNAAVYFPRTFNLDSLNQNRPQVLRIVRHHRRAVGPHRRAPRRLEGAGGHRCPAAQRAASLDYMMTDPENGALNPLGVNCLRTFPVYGNICWGARTLDGADQLARDWKYMPVRRHRALPRGEPLPGTKWVVFEPNDEPLWAQIRLNVGAFMQTCSARAPSRGRRRRRLTS